MIAALLLAAAAAAAPADPQPYDETIPVKAEESEAPPEESSPDAVKLEDVIVTATKREKSVRKIPSTINALYGEELEKIGAREMKDYLNLVPGITLQEGMMPNERKITIRGVGPGDGANQTTGQLIGDVPMTDPYAAYVIPDLDPFDLKTVEVLKGPQGTVFGASALNGAIRWVPNTPQLGRWEGRGFAEYVTIEEGGHGSTYGAMLNAPIGESVAVRAMGVYQDTPGVYDNLARDTEDADSRSKWSARGMARWQATERFDVNAFYLRQYAQVDDLSLADNFEKRLESDTRPGPSVIKLDFDLANLDLRYAFDWATLVSQTSRLTKLQDSNVDTSGAVRVAGQAGLENLRGDVFADIVGYTQEFRLVSAPGDRWSWIGGVFAMDYEADVGVDQYVANTGLVAPIIAALQPLLPVDLGLTSLFTQNGLSLGGATAEPVAAQEQAVFGEASRKFFDRFELTLGGRFYRTRLDAVVEQYGAITLIYHRTPVYMQQVVQEEQGFNPKAALTFQATKDLLFYAAAARGFQFGGVNLYNAIAPQDDIPLSYTSSNLWSYEAGVRTDWFSRRLRIDLTAFYLDWTDAQINQTTPTVVNTPFIDNVGAATSRGVETTLAWLTPIPGLSLNVAASYIIARTAATYENAGRTVAAGDDMPASPRLQTATTLGYSRMFGPVSTSTSLVHSYMGKAWNNIFHEHRIYDFHQVNFNFILGLPTVRYSPTLTLGVTNLLDERGVLGRTGGNEDPVTGEREGPLSAVTGQFEYHNRPRTICLRLGAQF